jgi:hypothetical protein
MQSLLVVVFGNARQLTVAQPSTAPAEGQTQSRSCGHGLHEKAMPNPSPSKA